MVDNFMNLDAPLSVLVETSGNKFNKCVGPVALDGRRRLIHVENGVDNTRLAHASKRHLSLT